MLLYIHIRNQRQDMPDLWPQLREKRENKKKTEQTKILIFSKIIKIKSTKRVKINFIYKNR